MMRCRSNRRQFNIFYWSALATRPSVVLAQQSAIPVIGQVSGGSPDFETHAIQAFRLGLAETGYVEGRNVEIELLWSDGQNDRFRTFAADLVRRQASVIVSLGSTPAALAAKAATQTIPIVFMVGIDPVEAGLVASRARPGGNITGVTNSNNELAPKRLELLRELLPEAGTIGHLVNPASPLIALTAARNLRAAARRLGLPLLVLNVSVTFRDACRRSGRSR